MLHWSTILIDSLRLSVVIVVAFIYVSSYNYKEMTCMVFYELIILGKIAYINKNAFQSKAHLPLADRKSNTRTPLSLSLLSLCLSPDMHRSEGSKIVVIDVKFIIRYLANFKWVCIHYKL